MKPLGWWINPNNSLLRMLPFFLSERTHFADGRMIFKRSLDMLRRCIGLIRKPVIIILKGKKRSLNPKRTAVDGVEFYLHSDGKKMKTKFLKVRQTLPYLRIPKKIEPSMELQKDGNVYRFRYYTQKTVCKKERIVKKAPKKRPEPPPTSLITQHRGRDWRATKRPFFKGEIIMGV